MPTTDQLNDRLKVIEKQLGIFREDHTPPPPPTVPTGTFALPSPDSRAFKFNIATFQFKGKLYVAEEVLSNLPVNMAMLTLLVASQMDGETFVEGILSEVEVVS